MMSQADGLVTATWIVVLGCAGLGLLAFLLRVHTVRKDFAQSDTEPEAG